jgi:hypothetical protein
MRYDLLERLHQGPLPQDVRGPDAASVQAYAAAGLVVADIAPPPPSRRPAVDGLSARVLRITPAGRKAIQSKKPHRAVKARAP